MTAAAKVARALRTRPTSPHRLDITIYLATADAVQECERES